MWDCFYNGLCCESVGFKLTLDALLQNLNALHYDSGIKDQKLQRSENVGRGLLCELESHQSTNVLRRAGENSAEMQGKAISKGLSWNRRCCHRAGLLSINRSLRSGNGRGQQAAIRRKVDTNTILGRSIRLLRSRRGPLRSGILMDMRYMVNKSVIY